MTNIKLDVKALLEAERSEHKEVVSRLNNQIKELQGMVLYERERREYAEERLAEYEKAEADRKAKRSRKKEKDEKPKEYSEYKSNGVKKKSHVDSIQSYTDFKKIQDFFASQEDVVTYTLWTVGVCMGVRISDLKALKWKNILNEDLSFKERIMMYEKKTAKLQNCLVTEAMVDAFARLLNEYSWKIDPEDFVFANPHTKKPYDTSTFYRKLNIAAAASGITYNVGTHSMRESFANIVLCVDKNTVDMNAVTKIQGLLNHSDPRVTLRYLGKLEEMYDNSRRIVSDFVLGKSGVDKLVCGGDTVNLASLMDKLDSIGEKLGQ